MKGSQLFDFGSSLVRVVSSASGGSGRSVSRFSMRRMGPPWLPPVSSAAADTRSIPKPTIGCIRSARLITTSSLLCAWSGHKVGIVGPRPFYCARTRVRLRDRPGRVCDVDLIWEQVVVDAHDPVALGRWWAEALGWVVVGDTADEFEIRPTPDRVPGLLFVPVPEEKAGKNRLHLDFRPVDQTAEVERLLSLGARRADVGQRDASWVVLADPEGQ